MIRPRRSRDAASGAVRRALAGAVALSGLAAAACGPSGGFSTVVTAEPGAMAVLSVAVSDRCADSPPRRVAAWRVRVDGAPFHDVLLFPGSGLPRYESLLGPLTPGRHTVELLPSELWKPVDCVSVEGLDATVYPAGMPEHTVYRHAPVLELRADTIGEQTDVPLYAFAERDAASSGSIWRYTVVFSNEDGGTPTRALFARWGRATDIEQVYEVGTSQGRITRESFQGPDHASRAFTGRRVGDAPVLLVATLNNMVLDRGRSMSAIRPVPAVVDLRDATRESTMDARPWVYRFMEHELAAEGRISADAPMDEQWPRVAPGPRSHVYLEARLRLDRTVAVAWATDRAGRRYWSHYEKMPLAIDRDGWVRSAVAVGADPLASMTGMGWACLAAPDAQPGGSCEIEASRAFVLTDGYRPGANLVSPGRFVLKPGAEAALKAAASPPA
jgi:hypothetical protein